MKKKELIEKIEKELEKDFKSGDVKEFLRATIKLTELENEIFTNTDKFDNDNYYWERHADRKGNVDLYIEKRLS